MSPKLKKLSNIIRSYLDKEGIQLGEGLELLMLEYFRLIKNALLDEDKTDRKLFLASQLITYKEVMKYTEDYLNNQASSQMH